MTAGASHYPPWHQRHRTTQEKSTKTTYMTLCLGEGSASRIPLAVVSQLFCNEAVPWSGLSLCGADCPVMQLTIPLCSRLFLCGADWPCMKVNNSVS